MAYLDLLLLAAIALFLGYRLWSLLGTHEKDKPVRKRKAGEEEDVIPVRTKAATVNRVQEKPAEESLNKDRFLQGAEIAFRQIVQAYSDGDIKVLKKLLDGPLLETFEDAINKRKKAKQSLEILVPRIVTAEILDKREEKKTAYVTVRFVSEQCLVTRNAKGKVVQGDPDRYIEVTDIWTFARPVNSTNPNWMLVATQVESD